MYVRPVVMVYVIVRRTINATYAQKEIAFASSRSLEVAHKEPDTHNKKRHAYVLLSHAKVRYYFETFFRKRRL